MHNGGVRYEGHRRDPGVQHGTAGCRRQVRGRTERVAMVPYLSWHNHEVIEMLQCWLIRLQVKVSKQVLDTIER
jgi:hypothetical protein